MKLKKMFKMFLLVILFIGMITMNINNINIQNVQAEEETEEYEDSDYNYYDDESDSDENETDSSNSTDDEDSDEEDYTEEKLDIHRLSDEENAELEEEYGKSQTQAKIEFDEMYNQLKQKKQDYVDFINQNGLTLSEDGERANKVYDEGMAFAEIGNFISAVDHLDSLMKDYDELLTDEKEKLLEMQKEAEEEAKKKEIAASGGTPSTSGTTGTGEVKCETPKIVCPKQSGTIQSGNQIVSINKKVTLGINNKIFPVKFNRSYDYLTYKVKKGSEKYISINSSGVIVGKKATGSKTAYVIITAKIDGKQVAKKTCSVKVYKQTNANAETQGRVNASNTAMQADINQAKNLENICNKDYKNQKSSNGKVTCKNVTITKGKSKKITKFYSTKLKSSKIKKITLALAKKNTEKKYVKKSGKNKKITVKAKKKGTIKYTLTINGKSENKCSGKITVVNKKKTSTKTSTSKKKNEIRITNATSGSDTLKVKKSKTYKVKVVKNNKTVKSPKVTWSSSNKKVATVNKKGKVTAKKKGTATITIKSNGMTKKLKITVTKKNTTQKTSTTPTKTSTSKKKNEIRITNATSGSDTLKVKKSKTYKVKVVKNNKTVKSPKVTWSSSNKKVATVNKKGKVTAKKKGKVTITIKSNGMTKKLKITVTNKSTKTSTDNGKVGNKTLTLIPNIKKRTLSPHAVQYLTANISPSSEDQSVIYSSSNSKIVKVTSIGRIYAVKKGKATITIRSKNDKNLYRKVEITVKSQKHSQKVKVESISLTSKIVGLGETKKIPIKFEPATATDKRIAWISGNNSIAAVDSTGRVYGKAIGKTTIKAISKSNTSAVAEVEVEVVEKVNPTGLKIESTMDTIPKNGYVKIGYTFEPINTTYQGIKWSSSNPKVATVDSKGNVKGIKEGKTTITAVSVSDESIKSSIDISIIGDLDANMDVITKDYYEINLNETINVLKNQQEVDHYILSSSNPNIVAVLANGEVTGINYGEAIISIASSTNNQGLAYVKIYVKNETDNLEEFKCENLELEKGKSEKIKINSKLKEVDYSRIDFKTKNKKVATVDTKGKVTGKIAGTTALTATLKSNSKVSVKCKITVKKKKTQKKETEKEEKSTTQVYTGDGTVPVKSNTTSSNDNNNNNKNNDNEKYIIIEEATKINNETYSLKISQGNTYSLNIRLSTDSESDSLRYTYSSSDPSIVSVSDGILKPQRKGTSTITIKRRDADIKAVLYVTVVTKKEITVKKTCPNGDRYDQKTDRCVRYTRCSNGFTEVKISETNYKCLIKANQVCTEPYVLKNGKCYAHIITDVYKSPTYVCPSGTSLVNDGVSHINVPPQYLGGNYCYMDGNINLGHIEYYRPYNWK